MIDLTRSNPSRASSLLVAALICSSSASYATTEQQNTGKIFHANEDNPGSAINLKSVLSNSETTLLFIHSPHCGPCKRLEPKIKKLASKRADLKIVDMTLDKRSDRNGIGWDSPAAKQFDIHVVPAFMIFDKNGNLDCTGEIAKVKVNIWLVEAGIENEDK